MSVNDLTPVRHSRGKKNFGKVKNKSLHWKQFKEEFRHPTRTAETFHQYLKMSEKEQRDLKAVNGFWMRAQNKDEIRKRGNALPCDVMTLDVDYATQEMFEKAKKGLLLPGISHFIHTSRRHTPENPRFRVVILLLRELENDYYAAASRICCSEIDPSKDKADPVSFRPAQMMFMPTVCKDGEYVFAAFDGDPYDWEAALKDYSAIHGDWKDISNLPKWEGEAQLRQTADKAEDPTTKEGPVGDFCRAYDVPSAIETFLSDKYEPVDAPSAKPRYTYLGGTTVNGAEVQDDGLFLYSHHGSDPCSDMLVNAFDLVRIHKFGGKDKNFDAEDKSPGQFPSWKAMLEFIEKDEGYRNSRVESRYDTEAMFDAVEEDTKAAIEEATEAARREEEVAIEALVGGSDDQDDLEADYPDPEDDIESDYPDVDELTNPKSAKGDPIGIDHQKGHVGLTGAGIPYLKKPRPVKPKPEDGWVAKLLEFHPKSGELKPTIPNISIIVNYDTRIRDAIAHNEFTQRNVVIRSIRHMVEGVTKIEMDKSKELSGMPWQDNFTTLIQCLLEGESGRGKLGWGFSNVPDNRLWKAISQGCWANRFHPIRETLNSFSWDGESRVERLFIDFLGCPDDEYHRETAKLFMVAAVTRAFEPGHKFDYVPVLVGGQGVGKSTFIRTLSLGWFGELTADFENDQKLAEQMLGCWIMEMAELVNMKRAEVEPVKQFISSTSVSVRMAYDREVTEYKRQTVLMGSTNSDDFLKDDTGNRRFWPIHVKTGRIDIEKLKRALAQLWAEATLIYREMRQEHPHIDLPLYLQGDFSAEKAEKLQYAALRVTDTDILAERLQVILDRKLAGDEFDRAMGEDSPVPAERRHSITVSEVMEEMNLSVDRANSTRVGNALSKLGWISTGIRPRHGSTRTSEYRPGSEQIERWRDQDDQDLI